MLKNLGHRSQVSPLVGIYLTSGCHVDDVKAIRSYDSWVHVSVVQEVSHNLQECREKTVLKRNNSRVLDC